MPRSKAKTGFGSKFSLAAVEADIDLVGKEWAEVIGLKPPSSSWDTAEVTHFGSPDQFREWIKTLRDGGEADIQVNMVKGSATDLAMQEADASPEAFFYKFWIPNDTAQGWLVKGWALVTSYDPEVPLEDRMVATARLKFTGTRTEAAAPVGP